MMWFTTGAYQILVFVLVLVTSSENVQKLGNCHQSQVIATVTTAIMSSAQVDLNLTLRYDIYNIDIQGASITLNNAWCVELFGWFLLGH